MTGLGRRAALGCVLGFLALLSPLPALAQANASAATPKAAAANPPVTAAAKLPESAALPLDPAVRTGKLANGLTYFVRRNVRPEKRADLWLAVNAGSVLEDEDQQGLAHFVEHMAFNGTKNFAKQEIINFLERVGMKFGPDVNAYTSFDETVYMLTVPTEPEILDKGLLILRDWAANIAFEDEEIDKERGVLVEEWRLGRGAEARMRDKQFPVLFKGSRYAERLPIGKKEILEKAPYDALRRFYRDWYRPDQMAVIVVGDIDPATMVEAIKARFAPLTNPKPARERTLFPVPEHQETLVTVATDPEATNTRLSLYTKLPRQSRSKVGDYRRQLVERLYHEMVTARLDELRQRPDPPFVYAYSGAGSLVRTRDAVYQGAMVQEQALLRGLSTVVTEMERVEKHGFTKTELERAKQELLRRYESMYADRDKQESGRFTSELLNLFLEGEPAPGIATELGLARRFVPTIRLDELNHLARTWSGDRNRVILVNAPEKAKPALPDEARLRAVFKTAAAAAVEPWVDRVRRDPLVPKPPQPAKIVKETKIPELGLSTWTLGNGVTVLLKPTDFKNDQVMLYGFSPGGSSLVPDARYVSTDFADAVLPEGGLGAFDQVELQKALAGKLAGASGWIGELEQGVRGNAAPADLETMFQLVYLTVTAPRPDAKAFEAWKARTKAMLENRLANPQAVFSDRLQVALSQGHFRRRPITPAIVDEIDLDVATAAWKERFGDAGQFTFVLVGAFEPEKVKPLVTRWLGGLPAAGRKETWKDVGVRPPDDVVTVEVREGIEPKSQVRMTFTGELPWTRETAHLVESLLAALRIRLREVLREDLGGVYGVSAGGGLARRPREQYALSVSFGCAPERVPELRKAVMDVLAAVKKDGFSDEIVTKVKEGQRRERETDLRENGFWSGELADAARFGDDPKLILRYDELVKSVTSDALRDLAKKVFDPQRVVVGVLYPEAAPAKP